MSEIIKHIVFSIHGAFLPKDRVYIDDSIRAFHDDIFSDLEMKKPSNDKENMHLDVKMLRSDFKKAVKKYKEEKAEIVGS